HIERTRMVAVVVDAAGSEGRDPVGDFTVVLGELNVHSPELAEKVALVVANKIDLPDAAVNVQRLREAVGLPVFPISAVSGAGCDELLVGLARELEARGLWTAGLPPSDEPFDPLS
ncbi:MAG: GTPase ObgE, partial [bacterium]|nr:GTPase ObgE [bacterium]